MSRLKVLSFGAVSLLIAVLLSGSNAQRKNVAAATDSSKKSEWRFYGGDGGSTKYSPLDQINRDNVRSLRIAWRWKSDNYGPTPEFYYRVTPLMADGVLYTTAGTRRSVVALDGRVARARLVARGADVAALPDPAVGAPDRQCLGACIDVQAAQRVLCVWIGCPAGVAVHPGRFGRRPAGDRFHRPA